MSGGSTSLVGCAGLHLRPGSVLAAVHPRPHAAHPVAAPCPRCAAGVQLVACSTVANSKALLKSAIRRQACVVGSAALLAVAWQSGHACTLLHSAADLAHFMLPNFPSAATTPSSSSSTCCCTT